jgi:hypothetical protein
MMANRSLRQMRVFKKTACTEGHGRCRGGGLQNGELFGAGRTRLVAMQFPFTALLAA